MLTRVSQTLKVAGGIVLNRYVRGINPAATPWMVERVDEKGDAWNDAGGPGSDRLFAR